MYYEEVDFGFVSGVHCSLSWFTRLSGHIILYYAYQYVDDHLLKLNSFKAASTSLRMQLWLDVTDINVKKITTVASLSPNMSIFSHHQVLAV